MKNLSLIISAFTLLASPALADTCSNLKLPSCDDMGYTEEKGTCAGKYTVCPSDPNRVTCIDGPSVGALKYSYQTSKQHKGWILCDGQTLEKEKYPLLFNVIGTDFGGEGSKFKVPDYRGYFLRGIGTASNGSSYYGKSYNSSTKLPQRQELPNIRATWTDTIENDKNSCFAYPTGAISYTSTYGDGVDGKKGSFQKMVFDASRTTGTGYGVFKDNGHVIPANYALNIYIYAGQ